MREEMVARPLKAAFFVGGMVGIQKEFDAFRHAWPDRPAFLFTAPGGRAADITAALSAVSTSDSAQGVRSIGNGVYALDGRGYDYLVSKAFELIPGLD